MGISENSMSVVSPPKRLLWPAGILRTAVPDMDRETQDQYLVLLQAKDMGGHLGGLSGTTTVTVKLTDVNDNPPRFTQSEFSPPSVCVCLCLCRGVCVWGGGQEKTARNNNYSVTCRNNDRLTAAVSGYSRDVYCLAACAFELSDFTA